MKRNILVAALVSLFAVLFFPLALFAQNKVVVVPLSDDPPSKYIFVTEGIWTGNLGGWQGADTKCQTEADSQDSLVKGRTFKAWITGRPASDYSVVGSGRQFTQWYGRYIQPTGLLVAKNYTDLIENGPRNFITEHADSTTGTSSIDTFVWTGIDSDGTYSEDRCTNSSGVDWSTSEFSQYGESGDSTDLDYWTDSRNPEFGQVQCNFSLALYCFEQ